MSEPFKDYPQSEIINQKTPPLTVTEQTQVTQLLAKFGFKEKVDD